MSLSATTNQPILTITNYNDFKGDVLSVLDANGIIADGVESREERYRIINIRDHFSKLTSVGELISVAYAGTKGFKCNAQVVALLADYQTLGKNTQVACNQFLMGSMKVLQYHRMAFVQVQKNQPTKAIKVLGFITRVADEMTTVAGNLETEAEKMCTLAKEALVAASTDHTISKEQQDAIQAMIVDLEVAEATFKVDAEALAGQVENARENEQKAAKQADEARAQAYTIAMVGTILGPFNSMAKAVTGQRDALFTSINTVLGGQANQETTSTQDPSSAPPPSEFVELSNQIATKQGELESLSRSVEAEEDQEKKKAMATQITQLETQLQSLKESRVTCASMSAADKLSKLKATEADSAAQREALFHAERVRLEEKERHVKEKLVESLTKLKGTKVQENSLVKALHALDLAIQSLGQIRTVFENTRVYWSTVKKHCNELANDGKDMVEFADMEDEFAELITNSWYSWMALAKINYYASTTMNQVMTSVDNVMSNLPSTEEAKLRLDRTIAKLENEYSLADVAAM